MNTIWITGAGGLIGSYLVRTAGLYVPKARVMALHRSQLDLTDAGAVTRLFEEQQPDLILHCAALSRSPDCEANPDLAHRINVQTTTHLARLASRGRFVFFSSDLVFDGQEGHYQESAKVNPLSVYARTKVEAEGVVLANPRHMVVRTSLNAGLSPTGDRGFDEQMLLAWRAGRTTRLFTDEFRCPIHAEATARAVWELACTGQKGLFHVAGAERLCRWEIGQLLAAACEGFKPPMEPASLKEYSGAPRPPDTSLNCSKAQALLSFKLPRCREWLGNRQTRGQWTP